jgi:hypothetical protein
LSALGWTKISSIILFAVFLSSSATKVTPSADNFWDVRFDAEKITIDLRGSFYLVAEVSEGETDFLHKPAGPPTTGFLARMSMYAKTSDPSPVEINFSYMDDCRFIAKGREFCQHLSGINGEAFFLSGRLSLRPMPGPYQHSILKRWLSQVRPVPAPRGGRSIEVLLGDARPDGLNCDSSGQYCALRARINGSFVAEIKATVRRADDDVSKKIEQQFIKLLDFYARQEGHR